MKEPTKESSTELDENQTDLDDEDQDGAPDGSEEDKDPDPDSQKVEIVLSGEDGPQPAKSNVGFRKRLRREKVKFEAEHDARTSAEDRGRIAATDLATLKQKNELLQLALDQKPAAGPPDPNDFDDGAKDTKYVEALHEYNRGFFKSEMEQHTAAQPPPAPGPDRALERAQTAHYEAAEKMKVRDYPEMEAKVTAIFGQAYVDQIIKDVDNAHNVLYFLGKNPDEADDIADLLSTPGSQVKAVAKLGALSARAHLKVKRNTAPDPDDELEGASVSRSGKNQRGPKGATFE